MIPQAIEPDPLDDLREHDREVLEFLSRSLDAHVAFQGIRRRLRIHPEQLSRALHRLARDDLVEKTDLGYRATPRALALVSPSALAESRPTVPILQTYLPATDLRALVARLKGRWVGPLRWEGLRETPEGLRLAWTAEDGLLLEVWVRGGALAIVAALDGPERFEEATRLGHLLFRDVSRQLQGTSLPGLGA